MMTKEIDFYLPHRQVPWVLRRLGCFAVERDGLRFTWGEAYLRARLGLALYSWEEGYSLFVALGFFQAFIKLPRFLPHREPREMCESWGFEISREHMLQLLCGARYKFIDWPFGWKFVGDEVWRKDGTWGPRDYQTGSDGHDDGRATDQHKYHYLTSWGEKQEVTATINVERWTWRRKVLSFLRKSRISINVVFSDEVGDRAGSWKGGCVGCSWDMKRGESPANALRRMERERRFT